MKYISLGCCCNVSFAIRKYTNQKNGPFDFNSSIDVNDTLSWIEDDFKVEEEFEKKAVYGFDKAGEQLKIKGYNIFLSHNPDICSLIRRIQRFRECINQDEEITFIRYNHSGYNMNSSQTDRLLKALDKIVKPRFKLIVINLEEGSDNDKEGYDNKNDISQDQRVSYIKTCSHNCNGIDSCMNDIFNENKDVIPIKET